MRAELIIFIKEQINAGYTRTFQMHLKFTVPNIHMYIDRSQMEGG